MSTTVIQFKASKFCAGAAYNVGDVAEVPTKDANYLIAIGAAEESAPKKKAPAKKKAPVNKAIEVDELETREDSAE